LASVEWDLDPKLNTNVGNSVAKSSAPIEIAEEIAERIRNLAPVDSGDYQDSIVTEKTKVGARVRSTEYYSTFIEFGAPSWNIAPQYVFRRAAESLGLSFRSKKK
jgi:hypothetical protein